MNDYRGFASISVFILIVVIVAVGSVMYLVSLGESSQKVTDVSTNQAGTESTASTTTPNLKTFRNEQYAFEFTYPSNLYVHRALYEGGGDGSWFISQGPQEPVVVYEDVCNGSRSYLLMQAYPVVDTNSIYKSADHLVGVIESNYKTSGGGKTYDATQDGVRTVIFDSTRYGKLAFKIQNNMAYSLTYQKCEGGSVPFDQIFSSIKIDGDHNLNSR